MTDFSRHPLPGIIIFGLVIVSAITLLYFMPKGAEVVFFQKTHTPLTNQLMLWITRLAEWPVITPMMLLIFVKRGKKGALIAGLSLILLSFFIQALKHSLPEFPRPVQSFQSLGILSLPAWELHHHHSFPSGHTASAAALYLMLYYFFSGSRSLILCTLAWGGVAISRMYLLQHFLSDVSVGLLIGFVFSLPVLVYTIRKKTVHNG